MDGTGKGLLIRELMRKAGRPRFQAADGACEEALGNKNVQVQKSIADPASHIPYTSAHPRCKLSGSHAHWDFSVSVSSLTVRVPGSQTQTTLSGFTWVPETQTQFLTHIYKGEVKSDSNVKIFL